MSIRRQKTATVTTDDDKLCNLNAQKRDQTEQIAHFVLNRRASQTPVLAHDRFNRETNSATDEY